LLTIKTSAAGSPMAGIAEYARVHGQLSGWGTGVALPFLLSVNSIRRLMHGLH
jgi:hypothetical protein